MNAPVMQLGLTVAQKTFRKRLLGGSDATVIMSGDAERITRLWLEKRGEAEPENLDHVLPVQMGSFTEPLNRMWFTRQTGRPITHVGDELISLDYPFMGCTLDGLTDDGTTIWEAKHVNAFAKDDEVLARYMPQLHHNMIVAGLDRAVLSVFIGTLKWVKFEVEYDAIYAAALMGAEADFWDCVLNGSAPVAAPFIAPPVPAIRKADMTGNNEWHSVAADWLEHKPAAAKFEKAVKAIKGLVPEDAVEAYGAGICVSRAKNGALTIKAKE